MGVSLIFCRYLRSWKISEQDMLFNLQFSCCAYVYNMCPIVTIASLCIMYWFMLNTTFLLFATTDVK